PFPTRRSSDLCLANIMSASCPAASSPATGKARTRAPASFASPSSTPRPTASKRPAGSCSTPPEPEIMQETIERAWEERASLGPAGAPAEVREAVEHVIGELDAGRLLVARLRGVDCSLHQ